MCQENGNCTTYISDSAFHSPNSNYSLNKKNNSKIKFLEDESL